MAGWAVQRWAPGTPAFVAIVLYSLSYVAGGYFRVLEGLQALRQGTLDINFLMVAGSLGAAVLGRWEEGAVLIFLFSLSSALEAFAVGRTRDAIRRLMALSPEDALVRRDGALVRVPAAHLQPGDLVIVRPGERIPADGVVERGESAVDEATITGESVPVDKGPGHPVYAGTINGQGSLEFRVTRPAGETTLARIIRYVEEAQASKAATQRLIDWVDRYYTLLVVGTALLAFLIPPLAGLDTWASSFYRAMMLLVVASPCALVISTPAAILSGIARGARAGVLFKGGRHLEDLARVRVVAFDKTGTLTAGRPEVVGVFPEAGESAESLLRLAAAAEARSEHPLAEAIVDHARRLGIALPEAEDFQATSGVGARARVGGQEVWVGSVRLLDEFAVPADHPVRAQARRLADGGRTTVVVLADGRPRGIIALADTPRVAAREAIAELKAMGVERIVMLTGDHVRAAEAIAREVGVDDVRAELLPQDKLAVIRELRERYGPVAMVGDGVNDAPALAAADVGIAMGGIGTDVALETADVVLMADDLHKVAEAIDLSRRTRKVLIQNLSFAVGVIVLLVTVTFVGGLTLPLAVVGHEGSTIVVALSGLRLLASRLGRRARPGARTAVAAA
ncbi:hypothetical protein caldi_33800 [Caldinitratiruptor microaerophilus]|uniref:P-type ATPase A domain-containing protein n=1 Tax=Caldinitratiruptor microaerophilus TaxID=671077 RepID=A0AA35CR62_9FIRM|nr:hypothetical protein caldi_33800 [Caldinitratiruptor microaerophilus]